MFEKATTTASASSEPASLARHIADSVESAAAFQMEHYRSATALQQVMDWLTERLGRPINVMVIFLALAGWTAAAALRSTRGVDDPWFGWLELAATICALMVAMLILVTQRREDQLARRRAQLTLEMALIADKKSSKIIALLEELRRDHPNVADRIDAETEEMATPADPKAVLDEIDRQAGRITADAKPPPPQDV
jgi:uncharacterized membrane protein